MGCAKKLICHLSELSESDPQSYTASCLQPFSYQEVSCFFQQIKLEYCLFHFYTISVAKLQIVSQIRNKKK